MSACAEKAILTILASIMNLEKDRRIQTLKTALRRCCCSIAMVKMWGRMWLVARQVGNVVACVFLAALLLEYYLERIIVSEQVK